MDKRMAHDLDNHITGHYGEDQFKDPSYLIDGSKSGEPYCLCKSEEELLEYAIDGGWDSIEDLEKETGVLRGELIGRWFFICGNPSRVFIR
jgi:hypothetical protein